VASSQLRGQSDLEKAQVLQWLGFADSEILPASYAWVFPCLGIMQYNKQVCNINVRVRVSIVVKVLCYKPEGHWFEAQRGE
jgi:hypothetical protein